MTAPPPTTKRRYGPARVGAQAYAIAPAAEARASLAANPWRAGESDALRARALLLELGEDDHLQPWHGDDLDARALIEAERLRAEGASLDAAALVELVHIDPRCHDDAARAALGRAAAWAREAGAKATATRIARLATTMATADGAATAPDDDADGGYVDLALGGGGAGVALLPPAASLAAVAAETAVLEAAAQALEASGSGGAGVMLRTPRAATAAWCSALGLAPPLVERPLLHVALALWNGRRVRLGVRDGSEPICPAWVLRPPELDGARLRGRFEAAALTAARFATRAPTVLVLPGRRAGAEARAALRDEAAPLPAARLVVVDDEAALDDVALEGAGHLVFADAPSDEAVASGALAGWAQRLGDAASRRAVCLTLCADLRPEQGRVIRALERAERALAAARVPCEHAAAALRAALGPGLAELPEVAATLGAHDEALTRLLSALSARDEARHEGA